MIDHQLGIQIGQSLSRNILVVAAYAVGSFVQGNARTESDFDLAVVVENTAITVANHMFDKKVNFEPAYEKVLDHGRTARQDAGLDARFLATRNIAVSAYGLWSLYEQRLAELTQSARSWPDCM